MHYMSLHVLLQLGEDKQEVIAQPSLPLDGTAEDAYPEIKRQALV